MEKVVKGAQDWFVSVYFHCLLACLLVPYRLARGTHSSSPLVCPSVCHTLVFRTFLSHPSTDFNESLHVASVSRLADQVRLSVRLTAFCKSYGPYLGAGRGHVLLQQYSECLFQYSRNFTEVKVNEGYFKRVLIKNRGYCGYPDSYSQWKGQTN